MKAISERNELRQRRLFLKGSAACLATLAAMPALSLKAIAGEDDGEDRPAPGYDPRGYRDNDDDDDDDDDDGE
ncbi:MAG: hypothetical protein JWM36_1224 [Hyphomicrobiales bacterium]|nr:hypothetical protein [Hyphomicrobiales bacterium]